MITPEQVMAIEVRAEKVLPRGMGRVQQYKIETNEGIRGMLYQHKDGSWFFNLPGGGLMGCTEAKLTAMMRVCATIWYITNPEYKGEYEI